MNKVYSDIYCKVSMHIGILLTAFFLLSLSGCGSQGLNSLTLPGVQGHGDGSYSVQIEMPNVATLTQNSPVKVNDVTVGSVSRIVLNGWTALITVSLNSDVHLPKNVTAKVGQTSLLGSQHLELSMTAGEDAVGDLAEGDLVPLERASSYPTTEQTLSSLSVVLNGGGLAQIQDITTELNKALKGRTSTIHNLIPELARLAQGLDDQKEQIIAAMEGLNAFSREVNMQETTLARALDTIPGALKVLVNQRQNITSALSSLGDLGATSSQIIQESGDDLKVTVSSLKPTLQALADSNESLTQVLGILLTFPFPQSAINSAFRGDYANLFMVVDLTSQRLDLNFLTGTPFGRALVSPEGLLGVSPDTRVQFDDPALGPLEQSPPSVGGAG
ncbi:MAG: MCE family protein [Mycobacteriaceae bacterium]